MEEQVECSVCFLNITKDNFSYCENCKEIGIICHDCENEWVKQNKNPRQCSICKDFKRLNLSNSSIIMYNSLINLEENSEEEEERINYRRLRHIRILEQRNNIRFAGRLLMTVPFILMIIIIFCIIIILNSNSSKNKENNSDGP